MSEPFSGDETTIFVVDISPGSAGVHITAIYSNICLAVLRMVQVVWQTKSVRVSEYSMHIYIEIYLELLDCLGLCDR